MRTCVEVATTDNVSSFLEELGFRYCLLPDLCLFVPCFPAFFDLLISLGQ